MLANAPSTSSIRLTACFICGLDFALSELTAHEKECLENIKTNDTQYTRQNGEDDDSSENSFPASYNNHHNLSTSSSSSAGGESSGERKYSRYGEMNFFLFVCRAI